MTLTDKLIESVLAAAKVNRNVQSPAAAVLWTDKEQQWEAVAAELKSHMPGLLTLGDHDNAQRTGPAIWLKCAIAGALDTVNLGGQIPVIYLPGISRADLRAIETCPRALQPLAELQYRGAFWSQVNGKDWTVNAFLTAKNGGLGLSVTQDMATQDALQRVVQAGLLLERTLEELQGKAINAAWLDLLVANNPIRDVLVWLNDPQAAQSKWAGARWTIFTSRCGNDFAFSPQTDGIITAAEKLAQHQGAWAAVWQLYSESFTSFKAIADLLAQLQPPAPTGLFDAPDQLAGYPRASESAESALRYALSACATMPPELARASVLDLEKQHGSRRDWLWFKMGCAPLVQGLQHLAELATLSKQTPAAATLAQLAASYQESGWKVDQAAMLAMAAVSSKADTDAIGAALRALYVPWLEDLAHRFQDLVKAEGRLKQLVGVKGAIADGAPLDGVCTVFVDGLRYDVAMQLKERLAGLGKVTTSAMWTSMPSVTASGKAWASPVAQWVSGKKSDEDFQPSVATDGKPLSTHNFRKLLSDHGFQVLDKHENGDPSGKAWVECGDLDHYGHAHGLRLARDMKTQLDQIVERLAELNEAGWTRFRIVTDHGWLLVPGCLPKSELPMFEAETRWGRCAVLKDSSHGTPLTFGWDWCKDVQIAFAPGISNFHAGEVYNHGGLTLQECLVPVLALVAGAGPASTVKADIGRVTWTGLRCKVEVVTEASGISVDIRTKAALADSTLVAHVRRIENGKVSLAVEDDANEGVAAFVVVL
ncbi:MAG: BREX-1 system phosphatase PglZ type B, partial [Rhodoferax sp.]